jgi:hypothetical protein
MPAPQSSPITETVATCNQDNARERIRSIAANRARAQATCAQRTANRPSKASVSKQNDLTSTTWDVVMS